MVAPSTLTGKGTAVTITAVEKATDGTAGDVWKVTLSATLGSLTTSSVLVEAKETGSGKEAMVTNPNSYLPCDFDFVFDQLHPKMISMVQDTLSLLHWH